MRRRPLTIRTGEPFPGAWREEWKQDDGKRYLGVDRWPLASISSLYPTPCTLARSPALEPSLGEPGLQRIGGLRAADVVALRQIAAQRRQPLPRLAVLDPFSYHLEAEVAGQLHRRAHDRQILAGERHVLHERLVDLDLVHGQMLEIGKRRVAGAEIVDREAHAHFVQLA